MTRIAVIGNCSALGLANAIQMISPHSEVKHFSVAAFDTNDPVTVQNLLADFDMAFPFSEVAAYRVVNAKVKTISRCIPWPSIYFGGFHPDVVYFGINGKVARSCLGGYNSRIVAYAYGHELSVGATADLFNALIYGLLGYFDAYAIGKKLFLDSAQQNNLDLEKTFSEWEASDIFMYTPNHPHQRIINDIARELVRAAGLPDNADVIIDTPDYLASGIIWPVYPEVARRLNLTGSLNFRTTLDRGHRTLELDEFIAGCFAEYSNDGFTPEQFRETGLYKDVQHKLSLA